MKRAMRLHGKRAALLGSTLAIALAAGPLAAREPNPFLPPKERQANLEARLQARIDEAVAAMEARLLDVVKASQGPGNPGPGGLQLPEASAGRSRGGYASAGLPSGPGLPGLPPLPGAGAAGEIVPPGAVFIGCLNGKAFFQDRAGSPFVVDPRAFPSNAGGAGACGP